MTGGMAQVLRLVMFALALLAAPFAAEAQPTGTVYRIGYLTAGVTPMFGPPPPRSTLEDFRWSLRALGYVERRDFVIEGRFADAKPDRLPALAAELVALGVDVIYTNGRASTKAAKEATAAIPIVFKLGGDPVEVGLVASLARPGGNVTGVTLDPGFEIAGKQLELFKEAVPRMSRVAVLGASGVSDLTLRVLRTVAPKLGITLLLHDDAKTVAELTATLAVTTQERAQGLFVCGTARNNDEAVRILEFAARNRLPTMYDDSDFVVNRGGMFGEYGGLMSYDTNTAHVGRKAATLVAKILKGAKPRDLPVERPTKFDLTVNLKTAKTLGLTIPPAVLARADEVIQ
jgi:putative tryptophan/tyrosine transport system substrate-binding protein